jgi:nicotinamide-nucleotide amidase
MTATLLTVGDELLVGQVIDTNATWLGEQLSTIGVRVRRIVSVGDDAGDIIAALALGLRDSDVVICTGGLGPTHDDITKRAIADALGRELHRQPALLARLDAFYASRGRSTPPASGVMADVPAGFEVLENTVGTAPGLWFDGPVDGHEGSRVVVILPGVPYEMRTLAQRSVLPRLVDLQGEAAVVQKTLHTVGRGESAIAEMLPDLGERLSDRLKLAFLPRYGTVRLRITALGESREEARARLATLETYVRDQLGDLVFGEGDVSLPEVVGEMLRQRGLRLALAESCTGGRVADALTNIPGASDYFLGGVVAYCNSAKMGLLGVDRQDLRLHGAVSDTVAAQMAAGARERFGADVGVATTGIAGPGGGTDEKPVGTLWIGLADASGARAVRMHMPGDRLQNKHLGVTAALNAIRRALLKEDA